MQCPYKKYIATTWLAQVLAPIPYEVDGKKLNVEIHRTVSLPSNLQLLLICVEWANGGLKMTTFGVKRLLSENFCPSTVVLGAFGLGFAPIQNANFPRL
jgi:hypothetical protein